MGRRDGYENTSAGQCIIRAKKMLKNPINEAATNDARVISIPDFIMKKRKECPIAASKADTITALRDGFEMTANPTAAMAAINPSTRTR